jgi:hypothetical protein
MYIKGESLTESGFQMFNFNAITDKRQAGWQHPETQTVRTEGKINGVDNTTAVEQPKA